jgi:hypothetical protein
MTVQRTGASRHAEWRCRRSRWLAPVADLFVRRMTKPAIIIGCVVLAAVAAGAVWFFKYRDADFPYIYNPANFVSADEIRQIEQVVRAEGERYLVSINIVSTNKAGATTGHGSLRPRSGRKYLLDRTADGWKIDGVEEWGN